MLPAKGGGKGLFISGPRVTQARDFLLWFSPQRNLLPRLLGSPTFQPHPGAGPALAGAPFRKQNEGPETNSPPGESPFLLLMCSSS